MPFTPSHAVVALPFIRTPLVPAAIAVGAMTPDLPLFVRTGLPLYGFTHDLVFLPATIVIALALLLVWRCILRPAAGELSPRRLAERLPEGWERGSRASFRETFAGATGRVTGASIGLLVACLALGVLTHIVWDLFTHEGRWGVQVLPALDEQWGPLPGYKWAQHGSSVVGLMIIGVWAVVWLARRRPHAVDRMLPAAARWTWWLSLPAALIAAWAIGLATFGPITDDWTVQHLAYRVLPAAAGAWGAVTLLLAIAVTARRGTSASARRSQG